MPDDDSYDEITSVIEIQVDNAEKIKIIFTNLKKEPAARRTKGFLRAKLREIQSKYGDFKEIHNQICKAIPRSERKTIPYFVKNTFDEIDDIQSQMEVKIEEWLDELQGPPQAAVVNFPTDAQINLHNRPEKLRLERIKIESFSGDLHKWMSFKGLYTTLVHENSDISAVEKFHHLNSILTGDAKRLISHYNITAENYTAAWKSIQDRFDNRRILVNNELKSFIDQPLIAQESAARIRSLLDMSQECLNSLRNLEIDISTWDPIIIHILVHKLDTETHRHWENSLDNPKDLPTYQQFIDFLEKRLHILENLTTSKFNTSSTTSNQRSTEFKVKQPQDRTVNRHANQQYNKQRSFFAGSNAQCKFCGENHNVFACTKFMNLSQSNRLVMVEEKGLCINCFGTHSSETCGSSRRCKECKHRHHTLLHDGLLHISSTKPSALSHTQSSSSSNNRPSSSKSSSTSSSFRSSTPSTNSSTSMPTNHIESSQQINSHHADTLTCTINAPALLATAIIEVTAFNGVHHKLRCLIDQGSTASFITESAAQILKIKRTKITAIINGVGKQSTKAKHMVHINIKSAYNAFELLIEAIVMPKITDSLPCNAIKPSHNWYHISGLQLADPQYHQPGKIDMLLGADVYGHILLSGVRKGHPGEPIAQNTHLGWILSGPVANNNHSNITVMHINASIEAQLKRFWELEELPSAPILSQDDVECERIFNETHCRDENGRYIVALPFKQDRQLLGHSKLRALNRFHQLEKKFIKNESFYTAYRNVINEYLQLGHMQLVDTQSAKFIDQNHDSYYLPHHAVIKEGSTTTKVRVVFDASAKTSSGESLNDQLFIGPPLQEELLSIIIRWRSHRIVLSADITKMYRQIKIRTQDTKYHKIFWRDNPQERIKEYELQTVTFGTSSGAYLAIRSLQQLAKDEKSSFPMASPIVLRDFYVDDLMTGAESPLEVQQIYSEITNLLSAGGFELCKWLSNDKEVLEQIPLSKRDSSLSVEFDQQNLHTAKTLGLYYHPFADTFTFKVTIPPSDDHVTKRKLLSETAQLFDPLGWLAPVIIKAKIMFQQLWKEGYDWDQYLNNDLQQQWTKFRLDLPQLEHISIRRWIGTSRLSTSTELHGFCDASQHAYAAAVYIRTVNPENIVYTSLIVAKTKVAPLKIISLPRLELCGAELLAKLISYARKALLLPDVQVYAWTDSEIVLAWLRGDPSRWKTFVANRVVKVQQHLHTNQWRHIQSSDNPADCASRGIQPSNLKSHPLWWTGPEWLSSTVCHWHAETNIEFATHSEEKRSVASFLSSSALKSIASFLDNYGSLNKLLRSTATLLRFRYNCKNKNEKRTGPLSTIELKYALHVCVRLDQSSAFSTELGLIRKGASLQSKSKILQFNPFVDDDNIMRIGGRLHHLKSTSYEQRHQIILSPKSHFSELIIRDAHIRSLHGGAQLTLSVLRKQFWILNGRNITKGIINKCVTCHRFKKSSTNQLMGNLPETRIAVTRPFTNVGVDYAGPIEIKASKLRNAKICKGYIAVFVCFSIKAVHIEVVSDLTTMAFLAAFDRFIGRRGLPTNVYSDNGGTFVGADRELRRLIKSSLDCNKIANTSANKGIQWHFIPPRSPHHGGLWEAAVKSFKKHFRRIVGTVVLTFEELSTVLIQIEACLNSRPLVAATDDPEDFSAISPGHFLIGGELLSVPSSQFEGTTHTLTKWKLLKKLQCDVWKQWSSDYLSSLQQRGKWKKVASNVQEGTMVLVKEDNLSPMEWMLGRIIKTHPGKDGHVRVVTIKTPTGEYTRSITKISPLPIPNDATV